VSPHDRCGKRYEDIHLMPFDDIETNYYFRFSAVDQPGVLSKSRASWENTTSASASVIQKGRKQGGGAVSVVMTTHKAREKDVQKALHEIDRLAIVQGKTILIRIEDEKFS